MKQIQEIIKEFQDLKERKIHPAGKFDSAGRWYPIEELECCKDIRSPSRAYPYSLLKHCRTLKHVCEQYGIDINEVKKAMKMTRPKRKVKKYIMYKQVAIIANQLYSVFSGDKYIIGKTYCDKAKDDHNGGFYAYDNYRSAAESAFPNSSKYFTAEKIIVKCEMWGRCINYDNGKKAFTFMKIIEVYSGI